MSIIDTVKRFLGAGSEPESVQMYSCNDCGNVFTSAGGAAGTDVTCPNCGSADVEVTVE